MDCDRAAQSHCNNFGTKGRKRELFLSIFPRDTLSGRPKPACDNSNTIVIMNPKKRKFSATPKGCIRRRGVLTHILVFSNRSKGQAEGWGSSDIMFVYGAQALL